VLINISFRGVQYFVSVLSEPFSASSAVFLKLICKIKAHRCYRLVPWLEVLPTISNEKYSPDKNFMVLQYFIRLFIIN
jgi:hypothetical protein